MEVRPLKQAQQRLFDFNKLFMDNYSLQIEATTCTDEPNNRVNIIFPSIVPHYQISEESWKDKITSEIYKKGIGNKDYFFFEVLTKKEYGQYLEEESSGIFDPLRDEYKIYLLFFDNHLLEVVTYDEPIFVYSYTGKYEDIGY
ncbi:MAG: hypothetical protein IKI11_06085 [Neisseriaceae bacterium]|nr:hypothetical protein [Neisseriaceae bacterium]